MPSGQIRPTQRNVRAIPLAPLQLGHSHGRSLIGSVPPQLLLPPQLPPPSRQRRPIPRNLLHRRFSNRSSNPSPVRSPLSKYSHGQLPPINQLPLLRARKIAACSPPSTGGVTTHFRPPTTRRVRPCRSANRNRIRGQSATPSKTIRCD